DQHGEADRNRAEVRLLDRLLNVYKDAVQRPEDLCRQPIPKDIMEQIEILRRVETIGSAQNGNILDVRGIADRRDDRITQRLTEQEMARLVGTTQPTKAQADASISAINADLNRGESICFPMFSDDRSKPIGWFFVGNTVD